MSIVLIGGISLLLIVLTVAGYLRDLRRGLMALVGTLGGAILVDFWGANWGAALAKRLVEGDAARTTLWVSCLIFLWSALIVGYGGGILLNRSKDRPMAQRAVSALLGLVNGVLIVGFLLRYGTELSPDFAATVKANLAANPINIGLPWLFLGAAVVVTLLVAVRSVLRLLGRSAPAPARPFPAMPPAAKPAAAPGAAGAGPGRISDRDILQKVKDTAQR